MKSLLKPKNVEVYDYLESSQCPQVACTASIYDRGYDPGLSQPAISSNGANFKILDLYS